MAKRGKFILFEGIDRSGKSTQCRLLYNHLKSSGKSVIEMSFPDRTTPLGKIIDQYLKKELEIPSSEAVHLLFSANRWELNEKIKQTLEKGTTIVMDRYIYSGLAFSSAKKIDLDWCRKADQGLVIPDIIFYLDIIIDEVMKRCNFGEERYEEKRFQQKVIRQFTKILVGLEKTLNWKIIDGSWDVEKISQHVIELINEQ